MGLEELKKQLYKKDGQLEGRPGPQAEGNTSEHGNFYDELPAAQQWTGNGAKDFISGEASGRRKKIWRIVIAVLIPVFIGLGFWFFWIGRHSFDKSEVALDIYGSERIVSGEEVTYTVKYKNNTSVALDNAVLTFIYSVDSLPSDTGNIFRQGDLPAQTKNLNQISAGQEGQLEFKARVLGDKDSQRKFSAKLSYRPVNINSDYVNQEDFTSVIISVPLILNFELPDKIVSGQSLNLSLRYINTSEAAFTDSKIKVEYPDGFTFSAAQPAPDEGKNVWSLPEIGAREEGKIIISGMISGTEGENKVFKAELSSEKGGQPIVYAQTVSSPQIFASPLYIEQSFSVKENLVADLGERLVYKIKYRNTTDQIIGPVIITVKIESAAADLTNVDAEKGFFNSTENTIIWRTSSLPELASLAAQAQGELGFSLVVKDKLPINNFSDKNFTILTKAQIDSSVVPLALLGTQLKGEHDLTVKINSRLVLKMKGLYQDSLISNTGPLPPRVGQETTYTIYWQVLNTSNDLTDVVVEAYLPAFIKWKGKVYPNGENIKYDAGTGKVIWRIDRLASATGILSPVKWVAFQIGLTPSSGQVGSQVELVGEVKVSSKDDFTGSIISSYVANLESDLPDDPSPIINKGDVQP